MNITGAKIDRVSFVDPSSFKEMGWGGHPSAVIELDNGVKLIPCRDPELNGMGAFHLVTNQNISCLVPGKIEGRTIVKVSKMHPSHARALGCNPEGHEKTLTLDTGDELIVARDEEFNGLGYLLADCDGELTEVNNNPGQPRESGEFLPGDICELRNCSPKKLNGMQVQIVGKSQKNYKVLMLSEGGGAKWDKGVTFRCPPGLMKKIKDAKDVKPGEFQSQFVKDDICVVRCGILGGAVVKVIGDLGGHLQVELLKPHAAAEVGETLDVAALELTKIA